MLNFKIDNKPPGANSRIYGNDIFCVSDKYFFFKYFSSSYFLVIFERHEEMSSLVEIHRELMYKLIISRSREKVVGFPRRARLQRSIFVSKATVGKKTIKLPGLANVLS